MKLLAEAPNLQDAQIASHGSASEDQFWALWPQVMQGKILMVSTSYAGGTLRDSRSGAYGSFWIVGQLKRADLTQVPQGSLRYLCARNRSPSSALRSSGATQSPPSQPQTSCSCFLDLGFRVQEKLQNQVENAERLFNDPFLSGRQVFSLCCYYGCYLCSCLSIFYDVHGYFTIPRIHQLLGL